MDGQAAAERKDLLHGLTAVRTRDHTGYREKYRVLVWSGGIRMSFEQMQCVVRSTALHGFLSDQSYELLDHHR